MKTKIPIILGCLTLLAGVQTPAHAAGPAARMGDSTNHGGVITMGEPTVLIGGKPAARITDFTSCPQVGFVDGVPIPHIGGQIVSGVPTVLIGGLPAACVGDVVAEAGAQSVIIQGVPTVLIGTGDGS